MLTFICLGTHMGKMLHLLISSNTDDSKCKFFLNDWFKTGHNYKNDKMEVISLISSLAQGSSIAYACISARYLGVLAGHNNRDTVLKKRNEYL